MTLAVDLIKKHEGFRSMPYTDTEGFLTIGWGTRLPINEREAELLLRARMTDNRDELRILFPRYDYLNETRQAVLQDMLYCLGFSGLRGFKKMRAAIARDDFKDAAHHLLDSKFARQTKGRALTLAALLESGVIVDDDIENGTPGL